MDAFKEATKEGELDYTIDLAIGAEKIKMETITSSRIIGKVINSSDIMIYMMVSLKLLE